MEKRGQRGNSKEGERETKVRQKEKGEKENEKKGKSVTRVMKEKGIGRERGQG